jgi:mannose-6-phosphate isomerase-like protein (cupin superfamily)
MHRITPKNAKLRQNPFNADVRVLFSDEKIDFLHLELEPGKILAKVKIDVPAYFYTLEGNPEVIVDNQKIVSTKDEFQYCPAGSEHCINNPGNTKARILVIKVLS